MYLRVISGLWKGTRLAAPVGDVARPTTDRVKESMFNLMGFHWTGGVAVDLFAGSGALGIEALSRGADRAILIDKSGKSMRAMLDNKQRLHNPDNLEVWRSDWRSAWERIVAGGTSVGWVFVDPPYALRLWDEVLFTIGARAGFIEFGVVCEHPKDVELPPSAGSLAISKSKTYGDICISLYTVNRDDPQRASHP